MLSAFESHPAQLHAQQFLLQDAPAAGGELIVGAQLLEGPVDRFGLAQPAGETHHSGLLLLVGLAQLRGVADHQQVVHHPPAPAQPLPQLLHRRHQIVPAQRVALAVEVGFNASQFSLQLLQKPGHPLAHRLWGDGLIVG